VLGIVFTTAGLWLSYFLNLTSGATIILVAGAAYLASLLLRDVLHGSRAGSSD
jgi:zinc transport system permease protein